MDVSLTAPKASSVRARTGLRLGLPAPGTVQRTVTVLAALSLFIGMRDLWNATIIRYPPIAAVLIVSYGVILVCAVAAVAVRSVSALFATEAVLLAVGALRTLTYFTLSSHSHPKYINDEGTLVEAAARGMLHGTHVYGTAFPMSGSGTVTKLMDGGFVNTFGYPPLSVLLSAPVAKAFPGLPAAGAVAVTGLVVAAVVMFFVLPPAWRSTATLVCFGLGYSLLFPSARGGYPTMVALPFLVIVVAGWTRVGRGGKLGRGGTLRAVCLGLAAAAQQLAWFLAPFVLVGMFLARRRELPPAAAARLTLRYAGVALGVFLLVNLPFIAQGPGDWLTGVLSPLTQHAVPHGQGLMAISYYFLDGSGALDFYSYAALLLLVSALVGLAFFPRRLGPAAAILPWLSFFLSTRSQDGYYTLLIPIWVVSALTTESADFTGVGAAAWVRSWGPTGPGRVWRRLGDMRRWAVIVPCVATVACLATAVFTPPPLRMTVTEVRAGAVPDTVAAVTVRVTNRTGSPISPHFAMTTKGPSMTGYWKIAHGPATLGAHRTALYVLRTKRHYERGPHGHATLSAVADQPMSISTTDVPLR
jgi:hypothetical protein